VFTALYRRYRPDTFEEVIGQEHVTEPLMQALRDNRVNHAYLFSGPRGCGKTSSARILARCLNCAEGPTPQPCGVCDSCVELGRNGSGSLDVVEIDAASHNGVDDARDLRERAFYAPTRDRYKVYILDEAHMVTTQGFNALLKLVEEPPDHVKFIFATTEPDKVISTIRSRTHHYPFRLVAPATMTQFLEEVAASEQVELAPGVVPLTVRTGGGSVRDCLSVLDQLIAGSGGVVEYEQAIALLGYTNEALLDETVDALAARDGATLFNIIERVVVSGHDPRRFVEDLLERLRDLVVLAASESAGAVLRTLPADLLGRIRAQSAHLGLPVLSQLADLTNTALTEMVGATSPRIHLELLAARLLLAVGSDTAPGVIGQETREVSTSETSRVATAEPAPATAEPAPATAEPAPATAEPAPVVDEPQEAAAETEEVTEPPMVADATRDPGASPDPSAASDPGGTSEPDEAFDIALLRRRWPEVIETLRGLSKVAWILVGQNAQVLDFTDGVLRLSFAHEGQTARFRSGPDRERVEQAIRETLGLELTVDAVTVTEPLATTGPLEPVAWNSPQAAPQTTSPALSKSSAEISAAPRSGEPTQQKEPPQSVETNYNDAPVPDGDSPLPLDEDDVLTPDEMADSEDQLTGLPLIRSALGGTVLSDEETI
jgi:DNA polymerase-3 subunit gamma/tau